MSDVQPHSAGDRPRPLVQKNDDEEPIRMALERSLKKRGYDVILTDDGNRALELARAHRPVLILSDIYMPGMDGHTLLANINRLGLLSSVVLMSGRGELADALSALREGAVDYMKQPWTPERLAGELSERRVQTPTAELPLAEVTPTLTRLRAVARSRERSPVNVAAFV